MRIIIAISLAVLAVAFMATVAQAGKCSDLRFENYLMCRDCCKTERMHPARGRFSLSFPGEHICKCLTEEEYQAKEKEWDEAIARKRAEPLFKSVGHCSDFNYNMAYTICRDCCKYFKMEPAKGRISVLFPSDRVCKCVTPEEKAKIEAKERK